jgi:hypothetical protein
MNSNFKDTQNRKEFTAMSGKMEHKRMINNANIFGVSSVCNYCGNNQKTPLAFSGMFRLPEVLIDKDCPYLEAEFVEIAICEDCFADNFNCSYDDIVEATIFGMSVDK